MTTIHKDTENVIKNIRLLDIKDDFREAFGSFLAKCLFIPTIPIIGATFWMLHDPANAYLSSASLSNGLLSYLAGGAYVGLVMVINEIPFIQNYLNEKSRRIDFSNAFSNKTVNYAELSSLIEAYLDFRKTEPSIKIDDGAVWMDFRNNIDAYFIKYLKDQNKVDLLQALVNLGADSADCAIDKEEEVNYLSESFIQVNALYKNNRTLQFSSNKTVSSEAEISSQIVSDKPRPNSIRPQ